MDAARTAKRLGAEEAIIVYRSRPRAHDGPGLRGRRGHRGGREDQLAAQHQVDGRTDLTVEEMELGENGRPKPTGRLETLSADALVLAVGQETDSGFLPRSRASNSSPTASWSSTPNLMTGHPGIFAGGDMVPTERTVTVGVGHGKKAARHIDAWLRGSDTSSLPKKRPVVSFDMLHLLVYTDAEQRLQDPAADVQRAPHQASRRCVQGLSEKEAVYEAKRCLSCGNCFECDGCYGACPEDAIEKLGPGKRYRYDLRPVHRLRDLLRAMPVPRDRNDPRTFMKVEKGTDP